MEYFCSFKTQRYTKFTFIQGVMLINCGCWENLFLLLASQRSGWRSPRSLVSYTLFFSDLNQIKIRFWESSNTIYFTDRLHLQNHKQPECHIKYNPNTEDLNDVNTMICEQVIWKNKNQKVALFQSIPPPPHKTFFIYRVFQKKQP